LKTSLNRPGRNDSEAASFSKEALRIGWKKLTNAADAMALQTTPQP
jgi:hypothetical protein